jgi:hypothetical protein
VTSTEVGENKKLDEPLVKSLTGGDTIAARRLYNEAFEFTPAFKLWLAANHKPRIHGTDLGIWRRVRLIPFTVEIPDAERDPNLKAALLEELPGILTWAVAGCRLWQLEGGVGLPAEVRDATEAYRVESDTLGAFLDEYCEIGSGYSVATAPLYEAYKEWAKDGELHPLTKIAFGRQLQERGFNGEKAAPGAAARSTGSASASSATPPAGVVTRGPALAVRRARGAGGARGMTTRLELLCDALRARGAVVITCSRAPRCACAVKDLERSPTRSATGSRSSSARSTAPTVPSRSRARAAAARSSSCRCTCANGAPFRCTASSKSVPRSARDQHAFLARAVLKIRPNCPKRRNGRLGQIGPKSVPGADAHAA